MFLWLCYGVLPCHIWLYSFLYSMRKANSLRSNKGFIHSFILTHSDSVVWSSPCRFWSLIHDMNTLIYIIQSMPLEWTEVAVLFLEPSGNTLIKRYPPLLQISIWKNDRLWPQRDTAVQQQYLATLWRTNNTGKRTPHDATTSCYSWHKARWIHAVYRKKMALLNQKLSDHEVFFHSINRHSSTIFLCSADSGSHVHGLGLLLLICSRVPWVKLCIFV